MPSSGEILDGLGQAAHGWMWLAIVWHGVVGLALALVLSGRAVPDRRAAAVALALPLVSVSAVAWMSANPFNGTIFGVAALLVFLLGTRLAGPVTRGPRWALAVSAGSIAFGLGYPHFLPDRPGYTYLFAAPTGIIPCPTLALVLGLALLGDGLRSRAVSITLGALGVFYALFGMFLLNVLLDGGLLVSAVALLVCGYRIRAEPR
jgi:hypothetical protein